MDLQLIGLCGLTFIIHLIGALAYAARIAGVRTRRIAVSFALFNVLVLVSRTSNSFQGPFLAKRIEGALKGGAAFHLLSDFRWLILAATVGAAAGALATPTFQRIFSRAVLHFPVALRSLPRSCCRGFNEGGLAYIRDSVTIPSSAHLKDLKPGKGLTPRIIALNIAAQALVTVAVFAGLYGGALNPAYRVTACTLSSVFNGVA